MMVEVLTVLFALWLPYGNEFDKALELVTRHRTITTTLQRKVQLKMCI